MGLEGPRCSPPMGIEGAPETGALQRSDPLRGRCSGLEAGVWPWRVADGGVASVLVSWVGGASPHPSSGLGRTVRLGAGTRQLPGRGGLGAVGGQGDPWLLRPAAPTSVPLLGWDAGVAAQGAGRRLGCWLLFAPGRVFSWLERPAYLSLPFCRLFEASRSRPAPFWPG